VREPICGITIALMGGSAPLSALQEAKDRTLLVKTKNRYKNEKTFVSTEDTDKEQIIKKTCTRGLRDYL
jgi:hypothetical protein